LHIISKIKDKYFTCTPGTGLLRKQTYNFLVDNRQLVVFDGKELFGYHAFDNRFTADRNPSWAFQVSKRQMVSSK